MVVRERGSGRDGTHHGVELGEELPPAVAVVLATVARIDPVMVAEHHAVKPRRCETPVAPQTKQQMSGWNNGRKRRLSVFRSVREVLTKTLDVAVGDEAGGEAERLAAFGDHWTDTRSGKSNSGPRRGLPTTPEYAPGRIAAAKTRQLHPSAP